MNRTIWNNTTTQTQSRLQTWALPENIWPWYVSPLEEMETLAKGFVPISLEEMDGVALLNRIDTKFVMSTRQLRNALAEVKNDYWMLSINGQRLNHYRTLYFDTPDFELYHAHVNGNAERYKVRSREYTDSRLSFLEVKHKTRKDRTIKDRVRTPRPVIQMNQNTTNWLRNISPLDGGTLEPKIWNTFTRMTLVNKQCCERVTLDIDLAFTAGDEALYLDGVAIAEVKMDANMRNSPFIAQMRSQKIHQRGFSKYSFGVALLYDQVKKNVMKPQMLWIEKMVKGSI